MNLKNTNLKKFYEHIFLSKLSLLLLSICFLFPLLIRSQTDELPRHYIDADMSLQSDSSLPKSSYQRITQEISQEGATWLRLFFKEANLGKNSSVTITSHYDGASQTLNAETIEQWNNSSAYFNGAAVTLTLNVAPGEKSIHVSVGEIGVGETSVKSKSQCGANDDRVDSNDNAIGRIVPIGCTGWIITNGRLVTAGHCGGSRAQLIEFNVPKSNPDRSIVHPGPEDQYPISNFVTNYVRGRPETDWAVFTAGANSQTGQTPIQAQGKSFSVTQTNPGSTITITGYGTDTGIDNQTQQIHSGPLASVDNTFVRYRTDTTGGNSGSPIIDAATGNAVGVHAYGGCSGSGGSNFGERATIPEFWDAMGLSGGPTPSGTIVRMVKRNTGFALDGRGGPGANGQNIHLWEDSSTNVNQQWEEIDQGGGFYSYLKRGTNFAIDGRSGGANRQNVNLWQYNKNNFDQHWKKVNLGGGFYRLEKRNAPGFSIDGRGGGANGQNVHLWSSSDTNQNQHWRFITVNTRVENLAELTEEASEIEGTEKSELKVSISPNPVTDGFSIYMNGSSKDSFKAEIYSIVGSKVASVKLSSGANRFSAADLSLTSGIYIINLQNDKSKLMKTIKLIVN